MSSLYQKLINSDKWAVGLIGLISVFFFVGLGAFHLFDWDEINFAESAREMLVSGDYLHVQINFEPFWEKPPFFFWLQAASMAVLGVSEFAARFPNAIFGVLYLITLYFIGRKHFDRKFGLIWALLFTSSLLPHVYFKSGIIDPVFNYFIFLSIYFMLLVIGRSSKNIILFAFLSGLFSGLAVLTKGPVGFLLLGLTLFLYLLINRFRNFPSFKYISLFLIGFFTVISSWLLMEYMQNGMDVLVQFVEYQIDLFKTPVAGHEQPFYYHFVVVFFGCFPISVLALPNLFRTKESVEFDLNSWMRLLFWVVIILFSIVTTKIIHYSSMTYLPLSFLAAYTVYHSSVLKRALKKSITFLYLILGLLVGVVLIAIPFIVVNKGLFESLFNDEFVKASMSVNPDWIGFEPYIGLLFIFGVIYSFREMIKLRFLSAILIIAISTSLTLSLIQIFFMPKLEEHTQGPLIEMCEYVKSKDGIITSYGFKSYATHFYSKVKPRPSKEKEMDWLLHAKTNKQIYFVSKIKNTDLDNNSEYKLIFKKGGYKLFQRNTSK